MSDSRITQAVAEVSAAIELLTNAQATIHELLAEDPAFSQNVQSRLRWIERDLRYVRPDLRRVLLNAHWVDQVENRQTA